MANPRIEVDVVANVAGVASGVSAATSQLDKLGKAAQATAPQVDRLSKATSQYNVIGLDFARVIQDAPFGIIGVGNNITQLAQSFSGLGKAGDTVGSKIKIAFSQIFSSGNALILGISLLTTAFTILQQKGFFKTEEDAKSLNERLKEYQETLKGVAASTLKGSQEAQKEIAVLKSLELQATNTSISTDKRIDAVNQLQKLYPDYFGNLTKEQILNGEVGDAYLKVAANLLAKAKAQAATNQIAENSIELLRIETKLEEQRAKRLQETSSAQAQIDALIEKRQKDGFLTQGDLQRYDTLINSINKSNESLKEEQTLKKEIEKINKENESLTKEITKQIEAGALFTKTGADANADAKEKLDKYSKSWDEYNLRQESANFLADKFITTTDELGKKIKENFPDEKVVEVKVNTNIDGLEQELAPVLPFLEQLETALNPKKYEDFQQRTAEFATNVRDLLQNNLANAFIDLGYTIGEALATGGNVIQAVGQSVLKSFGRFLGQFGEQLIAYGVATIAFGKASIGLSNPFTAIPSGGLAIAAGVALTAISGIIGSLGKKGMGGGGGGGGSSVGSSGVGGGSSFVGGGAQGGMFASQRDLNGELVVRGQDLVYVFGQANNRINKG